jgi:antibiotic biosynthesis monooxygenase (ABM) superfamily enzyme
MLTTKYLFEIHVYRLKETDYYNAMNEYIDKTNSNMPTPMDTGFLRNQYGGNWQYNEIIGFLKFYQYGANQIRCEYWETDSSRKKQFIQKSDSYCREPFSKSDTNVNLAKTMKNAVDHCEVILKKKNRHIDKELFNNTVDHVAWRDVLIYD